MARLAEPCRRRIYPRCHGSVARFEHHAGENASREASSLVALCGCHVVVVTAKRPRGLAQVISPVIWLPQLAQRLLLALFVAELKLKRLPCINTFGPSIIAMAPIGALGIAT